jgi:hypothetical protein
MTLCIELVGLDSFDTGLPLAPGLDSFDTALPIAPVSLTSVILGPVARRGFDVLSA